MTITDPKTTEAFNALAGWGAITPERLQEAKSAAEARGIDLEHILTREQGISRLLLLQALSKQFGCPFIEYDERLPIPSELLEGLDPKALARSLWMPVIKGADGTVVIAANNPDSLAVKAETERYLGGRRCEFRVALAEDIHWFIQDFLHAPPGQLIGTERTGLAFWRNTMSQWRTRLSCYRNDLAWARTGLAFLRWGLGTVAIADAMLKSAFHSHPTSLYFPLAILIAGLAIGAYGLPVYLRVRKSRMSPPAPQTVVEVTSATLFFLENYHFIGGIRPPKELKKTMLARLGDSLAEYCTILYPSPPSRARTMYARERNVLAAQRTIAACYRTIYARARTGLAFIRTGFSFLSIGLGLLAYFGAGVLSVIDLFLALAGILMFVDGLLWYLPVRKEQADIPHSLACR